jgi:hypothetical protein
MRSPAAPLFSLTFLTLSLVACDEPPTPSEVRGAITDDLGNVLRETNAALKSTDELPGSSAFDMIDRAFNAQSDSLSPRLARTARTISKVGRLVAPRTVRHAKAPLDGEGDAIDADATVRLLNEKVFTDANSRGEGVFGLPASLVCERTEFDENGNEITSIDPECASDLQAVDPRIRVDRHDGGMRFTLQVGEDADQPLSFQLASKSLSATLDLDEASRAFVALAPLVGEDVPNAAMSGAVTGAIQILGTAKAELSLSIDRDIAIAFADAGVALDGPGAFRLSSKSAVVIALTLDGTAKTAAITLGLGETAVHTPEDTDQKAVDLDLPGLTAEASFVGAGQPLEVKNISLGSRTTTLSVGGQRAVAIDLNADNGRKLSATITADANGETLAVSPLLDLRYTVDHAVLGDEPPVYDVNQVFLDGSLRTELLSERIEVMAGTFKIVTNPASFGFTATAGQCVTATEADDPARGSFTQWTVGACE